MITKYKTKQIEVEGCKAEVSRIAELKEWLGCSVVKIGDELHIGDLVCQIGDYLVKHGEKVIVLPESDFRLLYEEFKEAVAELAKSAVVESKPKKKRKVKSKE